MVWVRARGAAAAAREPTYASGCPAGMPGQGKRPRARALAHNGNGHGSNAPDGDQIAREFGPARSEDRLIPEPQTAPRGFSPHSGSPSAPSGNPLQWMKRWASGLSDGADVLGEPTTPEAATRSVS